MGAAAFVHQGGRAVGAASIAARRPRNPIVKHCTFAKAVIHFTFGQGRRAAHRRALKIRSMFR